MRIASLVPSATEALHALGLWDEVVAVTHECDYPPAARSLPRLTRSVIPEGLAPAEVDRAVRERTARGEALYELDEALLAALGPDLVVTQAVCAVCAVSYDDVRAACGRLPGRPEVLSLDPETLGDVLAGFEALARAAGRPGLGRELAGRLGARIEAVGRAVGAAARPRVAALEWLDPPYAAGHWVPEMIAAAGGRDVLGRPGERSRAIGWDDVAAARPDVVVVMPCGLDAAAAEAQMREFAEPLAALGAGRLVAVDAAASFSRPGPRLVDGIELLASVLHPGRVERPPGLAAATVTAVPAG